jgi:hypothetical protein
MASFTEYFSGSATGINAVTSSTTGTTLDVSMREQIGIVLTCTGHSSGNGVFTVDASNDGTNWVTGIALADATATASTTYVTSKTLSSNTSTAIYLLFFPFKLVRVNVAVTTDGAYTATLEGQGS